MTLGLLLFICDRKMKVPTVTPIPTLPPRLFFRICTRVQDGLLSTTPQALSRCDS